MEEVTGEVAQAAFTQEGRRMKGSMQVEEIMSGFKAGLAEITK